MGTSSLNDEAAQCRRQAAEFVGRPEAAFLLSVASSFDDLAGSATPNFEVTEGAPRQNVGAGLS
jgi:hypothetical protein